MEKILLIEDEASIRGFLKINLKRNNFDVLECDNGEEGIQIALLERPKIVILDVMLPGIDGFEVCKILREKISDIGIIMLTAKGQDMDKIIGLEYGADDYIVKPFNPMEVILRIKAILRRIGKEEKGNEILENGPFKIDLYSQKVSKNDVELDLTPKEYLLMKLFLENPKKAFTRDELLNILWGKNYFGDLKIIDVNIRRLRAKIENDSSAPKYIETIWGTGYRWNGKEYE
ncbi:response regulator transcription factor [Clostridium disporicum]|uniref:Stage 0 sporulation protein A homolog n=1 Tax=Clostridium disporicum TaxID=84024 RepID=A0A174FY05_9CLOT|nr:response regulator transcription factor [Clostridium disporicum]CUO54307.1 DNA-binding response regulator [Clostridium disporicum]